VTRPGLVLALCLVARLGALVLVYADPGRHMAPDSLGYESAALALARTDRFGSVDDPARVESVRTPGYPAFVAAVYRLVGESHVAVLVVQIAVSVATVALVHTLARRLWGHGPALASALVLALDPVSFHFAQLFLTDTLFAFCLMAAVGAGVALALGAGGAGRWAFGLGVALAAATLVRPLAYYLVFPVVLGLVACRRALGWTGKETLRAVVLVGLPWLVLVGGWQARNCVFAGTCQVSTSQNRNLLWYRAAAVVAERDHVDLVEARKRIRQALPDRSGLAPGEVSALYGRTAWSLIREHPGLFGLVTLRGLVWVLADPGDPRPMLKSLGLDASSSIRTVGTAVLVSAAFALPALYLLVVYAGAARGAWRGRRDAGRRRVIHLFVGGVGLYLALATAGPEGYARFRIPLMPLLALYAGRGLTQEASNVRAPRGSGASEGLRG